MPDATCSCCIGGIHLGAGRRGLLAGLAAMGVAGGVRPARAADPLPRTTLTPDGALDLLRKGNDEFVKEAPFSGARGRTRRVELSTGQAPFCVLVGCSDSRVSPELLFGRGLGELFIVRNAGNTVDTAALGSIEYGVGVLGCPLVVVLGHEACGAVSAAVDVVQKNATFPGVIGEMVQPIIPAVLAVRNEGGDLLENAVWANARRVAGRLRSQSPVMQGALAGGKVKVVAAKYGFKDGLVDFDQPV